MLIIDDKSKERFWANVNKTGDCWLWGKELDHSGTGYGRFWFEGKKYGAHRVSYEMEYWGNYRRPICLSHLRHTELRKP